MFHVRGRFQQFELGVGVLGNPAAYTSGEAPIRVPCTEPTRTRSPARRIARTCGWPRKVCDKFQDCGSRRCAFRPGATGVREGESKRSLRRTWSTSTNQLQPLSFSLPVLGSGIELEARLERDGRYLSEPGNGSGSDRRCKCRWLTCHRERRGWCPPPCGHTIRDRAGWWSSATERARIAGTDRVEPAHPGMRTVPDSVSTQSPDLSRKQLHTHGGI